MCELTWLDRSDIDPVRARRQHAGYVDALRSAGVAVTVLPALGGHPDAAFVEDAVVVAPEFVVLGRSGAATRRGELPSLIPHLPTDRPRLHLPPDALLDGGDVLQVGDDVFVGRSTRTNARAIEVLTEAWRRAGRRVHAMAVDGALHLKTAMTAVGDLFVVRDDAVDVSALRALAGPDRRIWTVPTGEPTGANLLPLPDGSVLLSSSAPRTASELRRRGVAVVPVEVGEFEKAEAGPTCLSILW